MKYYQIRSNFNTREFNSRGIKFLKTVFWHFWGVLWSVLDENWMKSSRNVPEPPYLPQNLRFLQENQKIARDIFRKKIIIKQKTKKLHDY